MPVKELKCKKCNVHVGEIDVGKIHKRAILLCETCAAAYEFSMLSSDLKNNANNPGISDMDMPDIFKDLFNK